MNIADYRGKTVHMIGIGGCSMSGLAQMLIDQGYTVKGSDKNVSPFTERLACLGVPVTIGHDAANVGDADVIVYTAAIKPQNPEREEARRRGIEQLERSVVLGQISSSYNDVVCISGCHGKTTITSMLGLVSEKAGDDCTIHVGGFVERMQGGVYIGANGRLITEACEYVESFLTLSPNTILINNIDNDHLDYYKDIDHIAAAFDKFVALLPEDGTLICCVDDARVAGIHERFAGNKISYGLTGGDYSASDISVENGVTSFTVSFLGQKLFDARLSVPGKHNVQNALGVISTARHMGMPDSAIVSALEEYTHTRRRFEFYGEKDGVKIYHDYAHHPSEIAACLEGARSVQKGTLFAVFQCNSFTRARTLFCGTLTCFGHADQTLVPDIFWGRDIDDGTVHARDMVAAIERGGSPATYIPTFEGIRDYIRENAKPGDMVVTLGSGDVYKQTRLFLE